MAVADQLQVLDSHRSTLTELRTAFASEEHLRDEAFQQQIAAQMANLQQMLNQLFHKMEKQRAQQPPNRQELRNNNALAPEGILMENHEGDVINNNAEFLEEVDEAGDEQNEEVEQADDQEADVELEAEPERPVNNEERRNQILAELAQLQQARNNLEHIIQDLRSRR
ncbi:unnamed protein product [Heligmosomoides polygyrus]|uniref:Mediator of RNA polymerase II transcription subunit 21 n=1 Tax=Heligmosomoides polygyrus TaxID=6339 RepID=A0A183F4Q3_HELPZ|nr:unnamed protein product [Heligmosomoides polygyrus]